MNSFRYFILAAIVAAALGCRNHSDSDVVRPSAEAAESDVVIPGVVPIDDEAVNSDPVLREVAARGGILYVRELGVSISFGHMLPPSIEGERLVVIDSTGDGPKTFQDSDVSLLCRIEHLTYLDLGDVEVSEEQLERIRKCHPACRIVDGSAGVGTRNGKPTPNE